MTKPTPKPEPDPSKDGSFPDRYEDLMEELEGLVENIESGDIGLEEAIDAYERGNTLLNKARAILANAEQRVEMIDAKALAAKPPADGGT